MANPEGNDRHVRQLTGEQWKLIEQFLRVGAYDPYSERLRVAAPAPSLYGRRRALPAAGQRTASAEALEE
ncbi:hypothetical protein GCM10010344_17380 [Streptomyces bluensis]|nr:hypothetical protein GCM10010344_17380 [Streptomyces bluensis]